jgi:Tol biopolymer transport system component
LAVAILVCAAQGTEKFGQNRVQYKDFIFSYYESDNFITHFYQGGQDIAKYVIKSAEDNSEEISKLLDFRYKKKIDIIVYNNINELNQTNIGIYEPGQNPGGTTKIPDSKIFIYFNGNHQHLDKQIREGIAKIYMDKMVLGTGFAEVIQNAVLLNLPDWYKLGLIQYIGQNWSSDMEDRLRDGILSGHYKQLSKLQPEEAVFVGHSIWHYIEEVHGKSALSNILYLTRINRSVDNGFMFVLGTNLSQTLSEWYAYYYNRYTNEAKISLMPPESSVLKTRMKKYFDYYQPKLSAEGKFVAYASNDMGRYKVHLLNTEIGKKKVIFRGGYRTNTQFTDESVPLLAWDPSGKKLAIINDKRSEIFITFYNTETGKREINPVRKFQKVVSFSFVDSKQLVMSAMQNGQTDIFLYNIASTTTRKLTDDFYDDLYPTYIQADSMRGIMFASNREDDTLHQQRYESQVFNKQLDLFFYDLDANQNVLYRVTSTPFANESEPENLNDSLFCFLSEANGTRNRFVGHFESVFDHNQKTLRFVTKETDELDSVQVRANVISDSVLDKTQVELRDSSFEKVYKTGGVTAAYTNYTYNIRGQSIAAQKKIALDLFRVNNKMQLRKYAAESTSTNGRSPMMDYMIQLQRKAIETTAGEKKPEAEKSFTQNYDSVKANKGNRPYDFQSEFDYGIKLFDWDSASASKLSAAQNGYVFRFSKVRPYFVRFMVDKVIAQVDNNLIMTSYQPFDPSVPQYNLNPVSFMLKFGITDLLENHKIYGGVRLPFVGIDNNSEYFITYENLKKRLDKKFTFYRRSLSNTAFDKLPFSNTVLPNGYSIPYSIKTNYAEVKLSYPLDVLSSVRFGFAFRNDKVVYKSQDKFSLNLPSVSDNWLSTRVEYVYDNCMEAMTNIRYGTRFKVFAEVQKEFPTENKKVSGNYDLPVPKFNNKVIGVFGFDLRHYQKIYKQIIWANRLAAGASFGTAKMMYYLGGLDNWITGPRFDKFDRTTPINYNNGYAFQTLATPVRGFKQNARNGDKFVVFNSELRIPIFAALINSPIKSDFIKNMQLVGFFDAGTAWEGWSPYSSSNPLFSEEIPNTTDNPSVIVKVKRYKTPVIMGFGPGIRTSFLGYFLRFDTAWGYDTGEVSKKPMYYFSFGLDF